jgi:hypothetical protein
MQERKPMDSPKRFSMKILIYKGIDQQVDEWGRD